MASLKQTSGFQDSYTGLNRFPKAPDSSCHTLHLPSAPRPVAQAGQGNFASASSQEEKAALQTPSAQSCWLSQEKNTDKNQAELKWPELDRAAAHAPAKKHI